MLFEFSLCGWQIKTYLFLQVKNKLGNESESNESGLTIASNQKT